MASLSSIIPKMDETKFRKILRGIGILNFKVLDKNIILFIVSKSRSERSKALMELADLLKSYGASYNKTAKYSGAGHIDLKDGVITLKPERTAAGIILKPGLFGKGNSKIIDVDIPYSSYFSRLVTAIQTTDALDKIQKDLLIALAENTASESVKTRKKVGDYLRNLGSTISINTINNDFGEVLGPLAVMNKRLLPIDSSSAVVFIPGRSNEPLLDYKITDSKMEYKISAKSGETTNTLKPGDVIKLIDESEFLQKKWKKKPEYKILDLLDKGTTRDGPIHTGMWMKKNGFENYFKWLKSEVYSEEVRQKCEDTISQISKEALDFTNIFSDATSSKIFYVKFKISLDGNSEWKLVETPNDEKEKEKTRKRVVFRSKNYVGRAKDKLGFQV